MPKIFSSEDRELIRKKMLEAGITLLGHKRYKNISVEEISAAVGVAKGTFYNFFPSKEKYFYEIMHYIKEQNRAPLLALCGNTTASDISDCVYNRYTNTRTVYDYFTPDEMKQIMRLLPDGDDKNDSVGFAAELCSRIDNAKGDPGTVVGMFNILAIAASNRSLLEPGSYESALRVFSDALAKYILEGK